MQKNPAIDFKLKRLESGAYDLELDEFGDIAGDNSFNTAILMSVFCERRASEDEVPVNKYRRGWWGNILASTSDFEIGSKIWLLEQSRLTNVELNLAKTYISNALEWLIEDRYSTGIKVDGNLTSTGIRVKIDIQVLKDNVKTPSLELWFNTGFGDN